MLYAYLSLVLLSVGGIALFLKGRNQWAKVIGFILFGIALLGMLIGPAILRQSP